MVGGEASASGVVGAHAPGEHPPELGAATRLLGFSVPSGIRTQEFPHTPGSSLSRASSAVTGRRGASPATDGRIAACEEVRLPDPARQVQDTARSLNRHPILTLAPPAISNANRLVFRSCWLYSHGKK